MSSTKKNSYYSITFIIMACMLFISIILSSTLGVANITFSKSMQILMSKIPFINKLLNVDNISETHKLIIINIRLPRIILSALIGAGLSVVGCVFQAIFKNPMADPYVLGISSGSALGASISIVMGFSSMALGIAGTTLFAFIGAIFTTVLVYFIAKTGTKLPTNTLLLAGVSVSFLFSSINSLIMIFNRDRVEQIVFWTMGSLASATWKQVISLFLFVIIGFILIIIYSRDLNLMLMGDETACSLGIEVNFVKKFLLIVSSIIIASCVSVSGVIGFVGLIVPHITRMIVGPNHKVLIPFSTLGGAIFMIICDTLSRILAPPAEIPVGAITALFGAPYFIYLLIKNKKG
ncbi:FecCD family ABC transporter permease [Clostridium cochlearium]|uniref:FecCD family ABC transporter permease n=1 Tax=Clostridium cochlearium TaxID=1494 RepID=UPI00156E545F|nr:iron chelate uptake ABC transporter family permease subunit [Clostridium cochlearium]MCG4580727.1 iron ABC transporter permease [Clostridium cochlearium]NSJ90900.1 iron chelate uptake ABC transporter family permease subunit [Coprococcus sp. MSK.21.13]